MKRIKFYLISSILSLIILSILLNCSNNKNPFYSNRDDEINNTTKSSSNFEKSLTKQEIEINLRKFAETLAKVVNDKKVLKMLRKQIGKKFDGQPEVLYRHIFSTKLEDGSNMETKLINKNKEMQKYDIKKIIKELENVINLQLFMPWFEKWDGEVIPLVAYVPQLIDDIDIREFSAFNAEGNEITIPIERAEDYMYIIVGSNERTDERGNLLNNIIVPVNSNGQIQYGLLKLSDGDDGGGSGDSGGDTSTRPPEKDGAWEYLYTMQLIDDCEPWATNGDPEIRISFQTAKGGSKETFYLDHEFDGCWTWTGHKDDLGLHHLNQEVIQWWKADYGKILQVFIWEEDGGQDVKWETSVSYKEDDGTTYTSKLSVNIKEKDDKMGERSVHYDTESGHLYTTGKAEIKMTY